jgi:signal transduction histidine kinase
MRCMALRENSKYSFIFKTVLGIILSIPRRITQPSPLIEDEGSQRKARFLSFVLIVGVMAFPILQITSKVSDGIPYYSSFSILFAIIYLISRTQHLRFVSTATIISSALLPFIVLIIHHDWESINLAFQILTWPVLAALVGSQLLSMEKEAVLIAVMNIGLVIITLNHPGILFVDAIQLIAVSFTVQTLLWMTAWIDEYYRTRLEIANESLASRSHELEIYTSLLRHDLGNDLQMVLGGIELSQMTSSDERKQSAFLESTLAAAERMRSLIQIFSLSEDVLDSDIITILEIISKRASIAFKGMTIAIAVAEDVQKNPPCYGRLASIAFENLLRNCSQHAGEDPHVSISLSLKGSWLEILFDDDGPGVDESIRNQLFERGVTTGKKGKGLGLYLTKKIIESENGHIEYVPKDKKGCCFKIQLPIYNE